MDMIMFEYKLHLYGDSLSTHTPKVLHTYLCVVETDYHPTYHIRYTTAVLTVSQEAPANGYLWGGK